MTDAEILEARRLCERLAAAASRHGDALYARMQEEGFVQAMDSAFAATPQELGAAAVAGCRTMSRPPSFDEDER